MLFAEGQVAGAGSVRQPDIPAGIAKLCGGAVQLVDADSVQAQVADQDFIPFGPEGGKVGVRPLLPVSGVKAGPAVLSPVAQGPDAAVLMEGIKGDGAASIVGAEQKLPLRVQADMAGVGAPAGKEAQRGEGGRGHRILAAAGSGLRAFCLAKSIDGPVSAAGLAKCIEDIAGGSRQIGGLCRALHRIDCGKGPLPEVRLTLAEAGISFRGIGPDIKGKDRAFVFFHIYLLCRSALRRAFHQINEVRGTAEPVAKELHPQVSLNRSRLRRNCMCRHI